MSATADKETFLAVYPRGTGRVLTWNSGACCGYAMENRVDDTGFLHALIDKLERDYAVDRRRIFATGISNGGMMSYRLACELSDKIAAIAPVEGAQDLACHPANRVSVIVFHGTSDHLVPFEGGTTPFQLGSHRSDASVASSIAFWCEAGRLRAHAATRKVRRSAHGELFRLPGWRRCGALCDRGRSPHLARHAFERERCAGNGADVVFLRPASQAVSVRRAVEP